MALDFTTDPGGLFPRIGRILHIAFLADTYEATLPAAFQDILDQYVATLQQVAGPVAVQDNALARVASGVMAFAVGGVGTVNAAWDTIVNMVLADQPSQSWTRKAAMAEVIRQMKLQTKTVKANVISVTPTAITGSTGTGVIVTTTKRGDGLVQENTYGPESLRVVCTLDSYTGGKTQGREQFSLVGAPIVGGVWDYDYPTGSSAGENADAIGTDQNQTAAGNIFNNGSFEDWSSDVAPVLQDWTISGGTWGTNIKQDDTDPYQGDFDVEWIAGTGATPILYQEFGVTTGSDGSTVSPEAVSSVAHNVWLKRVGVVTAGVLTVELVDDTGTVINDDQGVANTTTITMSALTTSYVAHNIVFRLPSNPPDVVRFRYHMSTALTGANVRMDSAALAQMTAMYVGGPSFAIFSGAVPFKGGDGWAIANTNDYGGATFAATFQSGFDRLFGMKAMGLLLPSASPGNILNTLITV